MISLKSNHFEEYDIIWHDICFVQFQQLLNLYCYVLVLYVIGMICILYIHIHKHTVSISFFFNLCFKYSTYSLNYCNDITIISYWYHFFTGLVKYALIPISGYSLLTYINPQPDMRLGVLQYFPSLTTILFCLPCLYY